ncbi:protein-S-isoprenylcysteine O-methyltransferase [Reticulomyxa filosa]|uniref:Protein-S-isoprenylcysteine O-methyltransferase n=1 Tax=Reticulomyxa filosa TaxID=46433 RepID=X6N330_RETFI|nr:protein-S-isoprenylcysteine O-methyltransferase [Reticulomyxa filosa]|eukprot:ETO20461.1 protein-S-isoprenylcysteine O-methyltransferase [Reticulomyxa filosa]
MSFQEDISTTQSKSLHNGSSQNNNELRPVTLLQRIKNNRQFASPTGLARNTIGGWLLGFIFACGIALMIIGVNTNEWGVKEKNSSNAATSEPNVYYYLLPFSVYLIISSVFYSSEFLWHAIFHPMTLDFDAFILYTHSKAFHYALLASMIEYMLELKFCRTYLKSFSIIHVIGLVLVCAGQVTRSVAMYTAGNNFTHLIATEKQTNHRLVTHGIYKYFRHPSYMGWFYWSIGTQLLLCNPICFIAYSAASWNFFKARIPFRIF